VVAVDRARALADKDPNLALVADKLPASPETLQAATDASDAVILHLWLATQVVTDVSPARRVSGRWWLTRTTVSTCAACTRAASNGPADLRALLVAVRDRL
jgi:hypothetical protein